MNITQTQQFTVQDYEYRDEILNSIGNLLNFYTERHSKVLVVRFDIHYPQGYTELCRNADVSKCMAYVIKKYKRQGLDPFYMWNREIDSSPHPHYHCVIFLDAQKVRAFTHIFETVEQAWGRTLKQSVSGCVHDCMNGEHDCNGKIIRRDAGKDIFHARCQEVFDQLSYTAKAYSKAPDNDGIRNFATSRIPHLDLF
jgi:hypothetical protein